MLLNDVDGSEVPGAPINNQIIEKQKLKNGVNPLNFMNFV
jgi:hypothetical protein